MVCVSDLHVWCCWSKLKIQICATLCCRMRCSSLCCSQFPWDVMLWLTKDIFFIYFFYAVHSCFDVSAQISLCQFLVEDTLLLTWFCSLICMDENSEKFRSRLFSGGPCMVVLWHNGKWNHPTLFLNYKYEWCTECSVVCWLSIAAALFMDCIKQSAGFICAQSHVVKEACWKIPVVCICKYILCFNCIDYLSFGSVHDFFFHKTFILIYCVHPWIFVVFAPRSQSSLPEAASLKMFTLSPVAF